MMALKPLPFLKIKPKQLPERKAVTICAGFKSEFGVILCADSQETIGTMKFDAPKLVIRPELGSDTDKVRMLFAGAGDGPFIDKLVSEMWKAAISGSRMDCEEVLQRIEDTTLEVYEKFWRVYPKDDRPIAHILFAIRTEDDNPRLFKALGPLINEVENFAFVGYGQELGTFLAENFRPDAGDIEEDVSAALFIMENAKKYVDSCGGATQMAGLMIDGSILPLPTHTAIDLSDGFSSIAKSIYYLFGAAINLENSSEHFKESGRGVIKEIQVERDRLRKRVPDRIKVSEEIKKNYYPLYAKIEWPPIKRAETAKPSDRQTSEDRQ